MEYFIDPIEMPGYNPPDATTALLQALRASDGSSAAKGRIYNDWLSTGMSDADFRALVDATVGKQSDSDWNYLQQIAGVQNVAGQGVADKAKAYNDLQSSGLDDNSIRALVTNAVGPQTDEDWSWLTSADKVLDLPADATVKDKATLYNDLQASGYNDANIRNIVQDVNGPQTNEDWSWLTSADKVLDASTGTVADKASTYNNLLKNSGLSKDQVNSVIRDVAGPQSTSDMNWLQDAAAIQDVAGGTQQQKTDLYNGLLQAGRNPLEIRQLATDAVGPQTDTDWAALVEPQVKGPLPPTTTPTYQSSLIQNLRANNTGPYSNNPGVSMVMNPAAPTSDWEFKSEGNSAFNPGVFKQTPATAQQVNDWNNYSTYRTNSLTEKQPYLSFTDWLLQKGTGTGTSSPSRPTSGSTTTPTTPSYDPTLGGG